VQSRARKTAGRRKESAIEDGQRASSLRIHYVRNLQPQVAERLVFEAEPTIDFSRERVQARDAASTFQVPHRVPHHRILANLIRDFIRDWTRANFSVTFRGHRKLSRIVIRIRSRCGLQARA